MALPGYAVKSPLSSEHQSLPCQREGDRRKAVEGLWGTIEVLCRIKLPAQSPSLAGSAAPFDKGAINGADKDWETLP